LANEVFGFNGWSTNIVSLTTDFVDFSEETKKYSIGVTAVIRVTLRDGVFHEDVGYGMLENSKSKGAALDKVWLLIILHHSSDRFWVKFSARKKP
jgi:DNA repair and recombination protein RAD52